MKVVLINKKSIAQKTTVIEVFIIVFIITMLLVSFLLKIDDLSNLLLWLIGITVSVIINGLLFFSEKIHIVTADAFLIKRRFDVWYPNNRFNLTNKEILLKDIYNIIISTEDVNYVYYSGYIQLRIQTKENKGQVQPFLIDIDKNYSALIKLIKFLKEHQVKYTIMPVKIKKVQTALERNNIDFPKE